MVFLGCWERRQTKKKDEMIGYDENIQRKWVKKSSRYYKSKLRELKSSQHTIAIHQCGEGSWTCIYINCHGNTIIENNTGI